MDQRTSKAFQIGGNHFGKSDTTKEFGQWVTDEVYKGKIPMKDNPTIGQPIQIDHNADLAIEFAEWTQDNGWFHGWNDKGTGWHNLKTKLFLSGRQLFAEFIKSKSAKPKTDQERIAELEKQLAELKSQMVGFGKSSHK